MPLRFGSSLGLLQPPPCFLSRSFFSLSSSSAFTPHCPWHLCSPLLCSEHSLLLLLLLLLLLNLLSPHCCCLCCHHCLAANSTAISPCVSSSCCSPNSPLAVDTSREQGKHKSSPPPRKNSFIGPDVAAPRSKTLSLRRKHSG